MLPALKPFELQETDIESFINKVITKEDFAIIDGKIEIKRDLALKLFALAKLSYDTQVISSNAVNNAEVVYIVKAKVYKGDEKVAEGLGACSTKEVKGSRIHHDALARAETRAFKRALEACVGLPFINEITLRLFGGYETRGGEKKETPALSPEDFIFKIREATHIAHLQNVWTKYQANLMLYEKHDADRVRAAKEKRKQELSQGGKPC